MVNFRPGVNLSGVSSRSESNLSGATNTLELQLKYHQLKYDLQESFRHTDRLTLRATTTPEFLYEKYNCKVMLNLGLAKKHGN